MPIKPETDIPLGYLYYKSVLTKAELLLLTYHMVLMSGTRLYSVSKDSIYDYLYGYNDEQETPKY